MKRYQIIYKNKGFLPNSGRTIFRSYDRAMKAVHYAFMHYESICLCTIEKTKTGYVLIESKEF